jgi:hypothetical protein
VRVPEILAGENVEVEIEAVRRYGERLLGSFLVIGERTMRMRRIPDS